MQRGEVDCVIVGSDRTTAGGDVCNKVGTYLKALAARDNDVPFYAALPVSTIDWSLERGSDIEIEERSPAEVTRVTGRTAAGEVASVTVVPEGSAGYVLQAVRACWAFILNGGGPHDRTNRICGGTA
jgi:methylthioribose-1-phosphate isomerase